MARVSVYITNYNYGRYLEQAVRSVLDQEYQDFELFLLDDGSTDGSREIMAGFEEPGRVFVVLQHNRGLNASNNVALKLSRGEFIMRLDADDYLEPDALGDMVRALDNRPDAALVFPDYYLVDEHGEILGQRQRHDFSTEVSLLDQPAHGACTMVRRARLLEVGGYDESFTCQDGYDLWLKITEAHPVINVNRPLFHYRQHTGSLSRDERRLHETRAAIMAKAVVRRRLDGVRALAVIPVRGPASDPASVALTDLGPHPLINWTVDAALQADCITDVVVTTPDHAVEHHIQACYGDRVQVLHRPAPLARLNTSGEESVLDALARWRGGPDPVDAVAVLFVEAPFRSARYIDQAVHTLQLYGADVVDAVRPDDSLFYVHDGSGLQPWRSEGVLRLEREDVYRRVGGLHIVRREHLERERTILGGTMSHVVLDEEASFTIRSEFDWCLANAHVSRMRTADPVVEAAEAPRGGAMT